MDLAPFERIDTALNLYYRALGHFDYYNEDGIGKFMEFCEENGLDEDDIEDELEEEPTQCVYVDLDEDGFPFIEKEQSADDDAKQAIIYTIIRGAYLTVQPFIFHSTTLLVHIIHSNHKGLPPAKYRPRKKNVTKRLTHPSRIVTAFMWDISKNLKGADGQLVIVPNEIIILCSQFQSDRYFLMAPC